MAIRVYSVQFSCSVVSDSLRPHGLQHARLPCPSPIPRACSNLSIELMMPFNHLVLCPPLLLLPSIFPSIGVFSKAYFNVIYLLFLKGHLKDMKIHLSFPWHSGILPSLMKTSNFLSVWPEFDMNVLFLVSHCYVLLREMGCHYSTCSTASI